MFWTTLTLISFLALGAHAEHEKVRIREASPEDGSPNINVPFLFHGDQVLTTVGRAGIFRSAHRGEHWQRSMGGLVGPDGTSGYVNHICQAASDTRIVYALAGGTLPAVSSFNGLFVSHDFGQTWSRRAAVDTAGGFPTCAVDPDDPRTVYVVDDSPPQVWKTTDGGQTVRVITNLPACYAPGEDGFNLAVLPRPGILYVDSGRFCRFASTDGGQSFVAVAEPPSFENVFTVSADGRTIFFTTRDASGRAIGMLRSIDLGASFVGVTGLPNGYPQYAFDPRSPSRIYATYGVGPVYTSRDGGLGFAILPASNDARFVAGVQGINVDHHGSIFLNTYGGPFRSDDRGRTFRSLLDGFRASGINDLTFDADGRLLAGAQTTQAVFRQERGLTYRAISATLPRAFSGSATAAIAVTASPNDPNVILAATTDFGVVRTDDGGRNWTQASGLPDFLVNSRMVFASGSRVFLAFPAPPPFGPGLYRSDDEGLSFSRLSELPFGALAVDRANPAVLYVGTYRDDAGLFKSTDGGQTLQDLGRPGAYSAIVVDARDPRVVYAGERFGQIIRSIDGGRTFAPASIGLAGEGVHGLVQDAHGTLFAWLRAGGLFASDDGETWHAVDPGEALRRSGIEAGRGSLVADPRHPGRVYLGNAGVIEIATGVGCTHAERMNDRYNDISETGCRW